MKKKFGIIGNPINHSLSPILHNYWFKKYEIDADYNVIEENEKNLTISSPISVGVICVDADHR